MTKEDMKVELHRAIQQQRRSTVVRTPERVRAYARTAVSNIKAACPDYLTDKRLVLPLIQAHGLTVEEIKQIPLGLLHDMDVILALAANDVYRYDD